jgi:DnaJ-class molecular chaperone
LYKLKTVSIIENNKNGIYRLLQSIGVDKRQRKLRLAFRKMARKYHPDLNPNDKEAERKFKELNEANEVLSSTENRKNTMNTAKIGKMQSSMSNQKTTATLPTKWTTS